MNGSVPLDAGLLTLCVFFGVWVLSMWLADWIERWQIRRAARDINEQIVTIIKERQNRSRHR